MRPALAWVAPAIFAAGIACIVFAAVSKPARGAEHPTRQWVLYDETADRPWTTPKGHTATSTSATACSLASVEATRSAPSGTRFSCRRIGK